MDDANVMRGCALGVLLTLGGCSLAATDQPVPPASMSLEAAAPFTGVWRACGNDTPQDQCSEYVLLQRDARICGTWSYVATGKLYSGRLMASALALGKAQRTRVCGRPGSETRTECDAGWQAISKPMQLCDGRLDDLSELEGACASPDFQRVATDDGEVRALSQEAWVQTCLAGADQEPTP